MSSQTINIETQLGRLYHYDDYYTSPYAGPSYLKDYNGFPETYKKNVSNFGNYDNMNEDTIAILSNNFNKYLHTILMLDILNCTIDYVALGTNENLLLYFYTNTGTFISRSSVYSLSDSGLQHNNGKIQISSDNIPRNTRYVKFQVHSNTDYATKHPIAIDITGSANLIKNSVPVTLGYVPFHYETVIPNPNQVQDYLNGNHELNDGTKYFDTGCVVMPENYTMTNKPVPLIIFAHGSRGNEFVGRGTSTEYFYVSEFLAKNGYAVADCSGITNRNWNIGSLYGGSTYPGEAFCAPSHFAAIVNLVKFLVDNYNIDTDNIFVSCKSAGGFIAGLLAETLPFNIKAIGMLSPALSPTVSISNHCHSAPGTIMMKVEQLGLDFSDIPFSHSSNLTTAQKQRLLDNISLFKPLDAFFRTTDISNNEFKSILTNTFSSGTLKIPPTSPVNLAAKKRYPKVPIKIWISSADQAVYYENSQLFINMGKGNSVACELRTMPAISDAHNVCTNPTSNNGDAESPLVRATSYVSKFGETIDTFGPRAGVPVAMIELVEWFDSYQEEESEEEEPEPVHIGDVSKFGLYAVDISRKISCSPAQVLSTVPADEYTISPEDTTQELGYTGVNIRPRRENKQVNQTILRLGNDKVLSSFSNTGEENIDNITGLPINNTSIKKFGLYVVNGSSNKPSRLVLNGKTIAKSTSRTLQLDTDNKDDFVKLGDVVLATKRKEINSVEKISCINITANDYAKLLKGELVNGYKRYNSKDVYNIVDNILTAPTVYCEKDEEDEGLLYNNQIDENGLEENTVDSDNTFHQTDIPFIGVRYFNPRINVGGNIVMPVYIDAAGCPFTNNPTAESVSNTFTVTIKDSFGNVLLQRTVYAGVTKFIFGPFVDSYEGTDLLSGETWFSIQAVDSRGVESPMFFYDILVRDEDVPNYYRMSKEDLTTYGIIPNNPDNEVAYRNKLGFQALINQISNGILLDESGQPYNGIVVYNGEDDESPLPKRYILYNGKVIEVKKTKPVGERNSTEYVVVNTIKYIANTDGYIVINNTPYEIIPRYTYYIDIHNNLQAPSGFSMRTYGVPSLPVSPITVDVDNSKFYLCKVATETIDSVDTRVTYLTELTPGKKVKVNDSEYTVGNDVVNDIIYDFVEICRNQDGKRIVGWGTDSGVDNANTAIDLTYNHDHSDDPDSDYAHRIRTVNITRSGLLNNATQSETAVSELDAEGEEASTIKYLGGTSTLVEGYHYCVLKRNGYSDGYTGGDKLIFPDNFTLDLGGSTWRTASCQDVRHGVMIPIENNINTHIKNGYIIGPLKNIDWRRSCIIHPHDLIAASEMPVPMEGVRSLWYGSCRYCSAEDIDISYSTGYDFAVQVKSNDIPVYGRKCSLIEKLDGGGTEVYHNDYALDNSANRPYIRFNTLGYIDYNGDVQTDHYVEELPQDSIDRYQAISRTKAGGDYVINEGDRELDGSTSISLVHTAAKIPYTLRTTNPHNGVIELPDVYIGGSTGNTPNVGKKQFVFVSFYDSNDTFISTIKVRQSSTFKVPTGTSYIRMTAYGISSYDESNDTYTLKIGGNHFKGYVVSKNANTNSGLIIGNEYGLGICKSLEIVYLIGVKMSKNNVFRHCFVHDSRTAVLGGHEINGALYDNCKFERCPAEGKLNNNKFYVTAMIYAYEEGGCAFDRLHFKDCEVFWDYSTKANCSHVRYRDWIGTRSGSTFNGCNNLTMERCKNLMLLRSNRIRYGYFKNCITPAIYVRTTSNNAFRDKFLQIEDCIFNESLNLYRDASDPKYETHTDNYLGNGSTTGGFNMSVLNASCEDEVSNVLSFRNCIIYKAKNNEDKTRVSLVRLIDSLVLSRPVKTDYKSDDNTSYNNVIIISEPTNENYVEHVTNVN